MSSQVTSRVMEWLCSSQSFGATLLTIGLRSDKRPTKGRLRSEESGQAFQHVFLFEKEVSWFQCEQTGAGCLLTRGPSTVFRALRNRERSARTALQRQHCGLTFDTAGSQ